jgi:hypothetical protein
MGNDIPNLLDKLSLRAWYKYLLYVAGVLLILVVVFGSKIDQTRAISFSIWTIVLSIFLWLVDDIINYANWDKSNNNTIVGVRALVHFVIFFIWLAVALRSFF